MGGEPFFQDWLGAKMCWCLSSFSRICADVSRGQMFIAIIKQPLLWLCVLSVPLSLFLLSFHFVLCWGGFVQPAASAALWLEREGGRVLLSRTLCFIFIKRAAFLFAPALTCDSTDCSTTLLLRKSCTYNPLPHTTITRFSFLPSSNHALLELAIVPIVPAPPVVLPSGQCTSLLIFPLLLILLLYSNHQTFAKVILAKHKPHLFFLTSQHGTERRAVTVTK